MSKPDYLKYDGRKPEPPYETSHDTPQERLSLVQLKEIEDNVLRAKSWTPFYFTKIKDVFDMARELTRSEKEEIVGPFENPEDLIKSLRQTPSASGDMSPTDEQLDKLFYEYRLCVIECAPAPDLKTLHARQRAAWTAVFPVGNRGERVMDATELRDRIALAVIQGELAAQDARHEGKGTGVVTEDYFPGFGERVWKMADAILAARPKGGVDIPW